MYKSNISAKQVSVGIYYIDFTLIQYITVTSPYLNLKYKKNFVKQYIVYT